MTTWAIRLAKPLAFAKRDLIQAASYKFAFLIEFAGIFLTAFSLYFLSQLVGDGASPHLQRYGGSYFAFVLIGVAFASYLNVSLRSFAAATREAQTLGTLEALLVTRTSPYTMILSSSIYGFVLTSVRVLMFLLVGALFFGFDLSNTNVVSAVVVLLLTIVAFSSLGILSASFVMVFKKGDPINWLISSASWLLGGVYYPVSILPGWLQTISAFLPITYSLEGMRMAVLHGKSLPELASVLLPLLAFIVVVLPASLWVFRLAVRRAKRDGSLTQF